MEEKNAGGSIACLSTSGTDNAATCATINKYGGQTLLPGGSSTTKVTITNKGTATPTTFKLAGTTCSQSGTPIPGITQATDLCSQATVTVYAGAVGGTQVFSGTMTAFASASLTLTPLAANEAQDYTFVVAFPASLGNSYQGLTVSQPMTWTFSS